MRKLELSRVICFEIAKGRTIRNNRRGGGKFLLHQFFLKARLSAGIFSRAYDLLVLGITACRIFFFRLVPPTPGYFQWSVPNSLSAASILFTAHVIILCLSAGFKILVTSNNLNGLIFRMRCKHKYTTHNK